MTAPNATGKPSCFGSATYIIVLLYGGYLLSFADRVIFGMVLKPIKETLGFSDAELGILSGVAFAASYAIFSPLAGYFVDRSSRKALLAGAISFWSAMTMATGLATSFVTMGLARMGVGAGEAFLHPLAVSLVSDTVPPQKRARAFSYYLSAGALGSIIALLFGGLLIRKLMGLGDLSLPLFGKLEPWEGLFIAAALLGLLFSAVVIVTMREPKRQGLSGHRAPGHARSALDFVKAHPRLCWALFPGISLLQMAAYTMTTWKIVFFERVHQWSGADAAVWIGSIGGASTLIGCLAGGRLIEWLRRRGHGDAPLRVCVISGVCYGTFCIAGLLAPNPYLAIGCFTVSLFWAYVPSVAGFSAMGEILPPTTRAQLAGLHTLTNGLISNSLGPFLVGFLSDRLFRDEVGIRYAMIATVAIAAVTGLLSVVGGLRPYRDRLNRADVESVEVQSEGAAAATT